MIPSPNLGCQSAAEGFRCSQNLTAELLAGALGVGMTRSLPDCSTAVSSLSVSLLLLMPSNVLPIGVCCASESSLIGQDLSTDLHVGQIVG